MCGATHQSEPNHYIEETLRIPVTPGRHDGFNLSLQYDTVGGQTSTIPSTPETSLFSRPFSKACPFSFEGVPKTIRFFDPQRNIKGTFMLLCLLESEATIGLHDCTLLQ